MFDVHTIFYNYYIVLFLLILVSKVNINGFKHYKHNNTSTIAFESNNVKVSSNNLKSYKNNLHFTTLICFNRGT